MTTYFETLMADTFAACGENRERALQLAHAAAKTINAVQIVPPQGMDAMETDAHILRLRAHGLSDTAIMERLGVCKRRIYLAQVRGMKRQRAAAKARVEDEPLAMVS